MKWYEKLEECESSYKSTKETGDDGPLGKEYSQYGEEGVLKRIFENITPSHKYAVELGAMNGTLGSTTKWLEDSKGWDRLMIEGNQKQCGGPINHEWITAENINEIFDKYKVPVDFDFLSLDIDGVDYWVWKSILECNKHVPKVVLVEYNPYFEINEFKAMTYDVDCTKTGTNYYGASIAAYKKLGEDNGYKLVHVLKTHDTTEEMGRNAFFIKSEYLPEDFDYDTSHIFKWLEGYKKEDKMEGKKWTDVS